MTTIAAQDVAPAPYAAVVIPAYRAERFLARAVDSVRAQTYRDWELIVVADDGADYAEVLGGQAADPRVRFVSTGRYGGGAGLARNAGMDAARARFVATLDADDILDPRALERLLPLAAAHGAAYSDVRIVRDETGAPLTNLDRPLPRGPAALEDILTSMIHTYAFVVFDRDRVSARWHDGGLGWDDVWFFAACFDDLDAIYHLDEPLYEYRRRAGSTTTQHGAAEYFRRSAAELRAGLDRGEYPQLRNPDTRRTLSRYLAGREQLEALYLGEVAAGGDTDFLDFVAAHRDRFYRLDGRRAGAA